jgi:hypothetical protein
MHTWFDFSTPSRKEIKRTHHCIWTGFLLFTAVPHIDIDWAYPGDVFGVFSQLKTNFNMYFYEEETLHY